MVGKPYDLQSDWGVTPSALFILKQVILLSMALLLGYVVVLLSVAAIWHFNVTQIPFTYKK